MVPLGRAAVVTDLFLGARGSQLIISATAEAGAGMLGLDSAPQNSLNSKARLCLSQLQQGAQPLAIWYTVTVRVGICSCCTELTFFLSSRFSGLLLLLQQMPLDCLRRLLAGIAVAVPGVIVHRPVPREVQN